MPASLAEPPNDLTETPEIGAALEPAGFDALSAVLRTIRVSGSLQFCFMPAGDWATDTAPSLGALAGSRDGVVPFHIVAEGTCWMRMGDRRIDLMAGDVVAFPFGAGHQLGHGDRGPILAPVRDLPPKPWPQIPCLTYGEAPPTVRLLCGFLTFGASSFRPLRDALPDLLLARTRDEPGQAWLAGILDQIVREALAPNAGGLMMLERLTEIAFIELLRSGIRAAAPGAVGWLAAMADPALGRCLSAIHAEPMRDWSAPDLAQVAGLSRSAVAERFASVLTTSPVRYVREWRLCLAQDALATTSRSIADIAHDAGYGSEAAFSRAFARVYETPPAAWRAAWSR